MASRVQPDEYREMLRHGTMSVGLYTPHEVDKQSPHNQDEVYIVASGTGVF
ncbi:MAG: cupin domain-containing protein, partial [Chloroflexi bacterium]|nr:cupin domain-containing protein [Chloroflexota bacterium]